MKVVTELQYSAWLVSRTMRVGRQAIGKNDGVRLGQSFINTFFKEGQTDPELFYCEDDSKVFDLLIKYVDWGNFNEQM